MDYVMRRRSTVGGALEMFSLPLPLPLPLLLWVYATPYSALDAILQELSYRQQIARQLRTTIRRGHLRDLEIYVKGHSRSLETEPMDRSYTTYY